MCVLWHTLHSDVSRIYFTVMLAAGAYRCIERGHCASLQRRVTRLTNTWYKGLEIPGLFINTVGFVSFLNWICVFASLPGWICSNGTVLTNSHVSSGHYQRCNHETAPMGKAVESLSTDFHTFLQMICQVSYNFHVSYRFLLIEYTTETACNRKY